MPPETMPRWTDYIPVDDLVPDPRNPKGHDEDGLDESLDEFGYTEQVMVDERTGMLVAGHGRRELVLRARDRGLDVPDGIVVDDSGRWFMPVLRGWSSRDDDHAYRYLVGSNRHGENGGWVDDLLAQGLRLLQDTEAGLRGSGFSDAQVEDLLASIAPPGNLGDLTAKYGDPGESDLWPVLRFKVSPKSRSRYLALVEGIAGSDADLFDHVLDLAETGKSQPVPKDDRADHDVVIVS